MKAAILNSYRLTAKKEHARILQRRQVIEERKEQLENLNDMRVSDVDLLFFFSSFLVCCFFLLTAVTSLGNKKFLKIGKGWVVWRGSGTVMAACEQTFSLAVRCVCCFRRLPAAWLVGWRRQWEQTVMGLVLHQGSIFTLHWMKNHATCFHSQSLTHTDMHSFYSE